MLKGKYSVMTPINDKKNKEPSSVFTRCLIVILLFCTWPMINFVYTNRQQLDGSGLLLIVIILLLTLLLAYLAFYLLHRLASRSKPIAASITIVCFLLLFFNYYLIYDGLVYLFSSLNLSTGENYTYALIVGAICAISFFTLNKQKILDLLLVFGGVAITIPLIGSVYFFTSSLESNNKTETPTAKSNEQSKPLLSSPDIFHIILDAYAREDVLKKITNWDNSNFLDALKQRDFYIANKSNSNYPQTFASIASTLEMNYLATETTAPYTNRSDFNRSIQGENSVIRYLKQQQYRFAYLGSGTWDASKCTGHEDLCLSSNNAVEQALLYLTPLRKFIKSQRTTVPDLESRLDEILGSKIATYTFAHLLSPHPPRNFSKNCNQILIKGGGLMTDFWGDKKGYVNDIKCLNKQLLGLIDAIQQRAPDAVIILNGDHGTAFSVDWNLPIEEWPTSQIEERFAILMGIRLPKHCVTHLYNTISPVNIYPLLFACLQKKNPSLRPEKIYITAKEGHYQFGSAFKYQPQSNPQ